MDDIIILSIGRQFIEMAVRMEQVNQALKQAQEKLQAKQESPKET